jgi:hypothetical protein
MALTQVPQQYFTGDYDKMAICTQCGLLLHDDDIDTHICQEEDKPKKGKPIKFEKKL